MLRKSLLISFCCLLFALASGEANFEPNAQREVPIGPARPNAPKTVTFRFIRDLDSSLNMDIFLGTTLALEKDGVEWVSTPIKVGDGGLQCTVENVSPGVYGLKVPVLKMVAQVDILAQPRARISYDFRIGKRGILIAPTPEPGAGIVIEPNQHSLPSFPAAAAELGTWWKNSDVVKETSLTGSQISAIEQIFLRHRGRLSDLRSELDRQDEQLKLLVDDSQPDELKVYPQIEQYLKARSDLERENTSMLFSIRRVLTLDQWRKLEGFRRH